MKKNTHIYKIVGLIAIIGVAILGYMYYSSTQTKEITTVAEKGIIEQKVFVTGKVKTNTDADLAFEKSGTVAKIFVHEGEEIHAGQVLATLDTSDSAARVAQAKALLAVAQAQLDKFQSGARSEEINIKKTNISANQYSLDNTYALARETARNGNQTIIDTIKIKNRDVWNENSGRYTMSVNSCDTALANTISDSRTSFEYSINTLPEITDTLSGSELDAALSQIKTAASTAKSILDNVNLFINLPCTTGGSNLETMRTNVSASKVSLQSLITSLTQAQNDIKTNKSTVQKSERDLELTLAGTDSSTIRGQVASVQQARSQLQEAEATFAKNTLRSPINGTVTTVDIKQGELASVGKTVFKIVGSGGLSTEALVTESDIAKIELGNDAKISVEAISADMTLDGKVSLIDPVETNEEGNPLYRIRIDFVDTNSKIKSGMTTKIVITTDSHTDVLRIPTRYITTKDSEKSVTVITGSGRTKNYTTKTVTTGLKSTDGYTEILSGINVGDTLLEPEAEINKKAQAK